MTPTRRQALRGLAVSVALPALDALAPRARAATPAPRRLVAVCTTLGLYGPAFFPARAGADFEPPPYLRPLEPFRGQYTVFSGLSHPGVDGGHESERSFLTAAPHPGRPGFRNTASLDRVLADAVGADTRFAALALNTSYEGSSSLSWSRNGVMVPADGRPARVFAKLFLTGGPAEVRAQAEELRRGRSVLDAVRAQAARARASAGRADRERLDEYFAAVREAEGKLHKAGAWAARPRPTPPGPPPADAAPPADLIARSRLMYDLAALALRTDSTRAVTLNVQGTGLVVPLPGVTAHHHELSHHGKDPDKLRQLQAVEGEELRALADFLGQLRRAPEAGGTVLDRTAVLFGSNLGNANNHDTRDLPVLVAGGGLPHAGHLAFADRPPPLCNLFLTLLRQCGVPAESFGSSTGTLRGFGPTA